MVIHWKKSMGPAIFNKHGRYTKTHFSTATLRTMKRKIVYSSSDQGYLAETFRINDGHVLSVSKIALLKIQSWKFALSTPQIGSTYLHSIEEVIRNSFFNYVPSSHVLTQESFFQSPRDN
jgi:hypothetical protein